MKRHPQPLHSPSGRVEPKRGEGNHTGQASPQERAPSSNRNSGHKDEPNPRRGFVLLMTLVLIAIAGLLLASLARKSLNAAVSVSRRTDAVQHRWATYSIQRSLLRRVEPILAANDKQPSGDETNETRDALFRLTATVELGGSEYLIDLADESAKVDLNVIHRINGEQSVRRSLSKFGGTGPTRRLRPYNNKPDSGLPAFDSWGQVFELSAEPSPTKSATTIRNATRQITLWSGRRLNIRRASPEAFRFMCDAILIGAQSGRLVKLRQENPTWTIAELTKAASLSDREAEQFQAAFGTGSAGSSLWIINTTDPHPPELHITERDGGRTYMTSFTW